jgi:uncharacterized repeat protein (TIGR01451 family)
MFSQNEFSLQPLLLACAFTAAVGLTACDDGDRGEVREVETRTVHVGGGDDDGFTLERVGQGQFYADGASEYTLRVSNDGEQTLKNVVIHESISSNFSVKQVNQSPSEANGESKMQTVQHQVGTLAPGDSKEITVNGTVRGEGEVEICSWVTYDVAECQTFAIVNPELMLDHKFVDGDGNERGAAYRCDEIFIVYTLKNQGTGATPPVTINEQLPDGLKLADGKSQVTIEAGEIEAGETFESDAMEIDLESYEGNRLSARAVAEADQIGQVSSSSNLRILNPELQLQVSAPSEEYINRDISMDVTLTNTGDGPAKDVVIDLPIPDDAERVSVSRGDVKQGDDGEFELETLAAGDSVNFTVRFMTEEAGQINAEAVASAYCVAEVKKAVSMNLVGIPALQVEMVDSTDPVKVGETTEYEIKLINEGTAADLNVAMTASIPQGFSFVEATGKPKGAADGNNITFDAIETLEPGEEYVAIIKVKADSATQGKFKVEVNSQELRQTLIEEEPTNSF